MFYASSCQKVIENSVVGSNFWYLSSCVQKKSTDYSSLHQAFFCAAQKQLHIFLIERETSTIKCTILEAIGVPVPVCYRAAQPKCLEIMPPVIN